MVVMGRRISRLGAGRGLGLNGSFGTLGRLKPAGKLKLAPPSGLEDGGWVGLGLNGSFGNLRCPGSARLRVGLGWVKPVGTVKLALSSGSFRRRRPSCGVGLGSFGWVSRLKSVGKLKISVILASDDTVPSARSMGVGPNVRRPWEVACD